ncbi:hypothetical protein E5082_10855 [Streptomyces griseoluteus]|uniref:Uncharacterized protein n=1 Tax=Streptomyces griseoluteus TaxID=29306 RepID=A0A4Z1DMC5_STRGP|nr:hypothetical protein E5082_10855 [Streptomyces griseoluteus]GHF01806.1 hypothetical protein GCM10017776_19000 [Streptomyces griseoluteus]
MLRDDDGTRPGGELLSGPEPDLAAADGCPDAPPRVGFFTDTSVEDVRRGHPARPASARSGVGGGGAGLPGAGGHRRADRYGTPTRAGKVSPRTCGR